jgi:alpha-ketoglutarate-dependent taurine dioxygenase
MPDFINEAAYTELVECGLTAFTNPSASALGKFFARLDSRWTGNPFERGFQELVPSSRAAARPGSLSSFTGAGAQPMHTDAAYLASPPRYLVFECVDPDHLLHLGNR